jgi:hypothetical protein
MTELINGESALIIKGTQMGTTLVREKSVSQHSENSIDDEALEVEDDEPTVKNKTVSVSKSMENVTEVITALRSSDSERNVDPSPTVSKF